MIFLFYDGWYEFTVAGVRKWEGKSRWNYSYMKVEYIMLQRISELLYKT